MNQQIQIRLNIFKLFKRMHDITEQPLAKLFCAFVNELNNNYKFKNNFLQKFCDDLKTLSYNCNIDGKLLENCIDLIQDFNNNFIKIVQDDELSTFNEYLQYLLQ
jgi:hypothetical protein